MIRLTQRPPFKGTITVPGDKSISHRAIIFASLAEGTSRITGFLRGEDTMNTLAAFKKMGIGLVEESRGALVVTGAGLRGLKEPSDLLDCGNSGTMARLIVGLLAAQPFFSVLTGDETLRRRPMKRVTGPLREMGARIEGRDNGALLPLAVLPNRESLKPLNYNSPVASAQVKSSLMLAALYGTGPQRISEPELSRDHTERMLTALGAKVERAGTTVTLHPPQRLNAQDIEVPGDISSAAFFLAGAAMRPGSDLVVRHIGLNPTRTGVVDLLRRMGAVIEIENPREIGGEPVGDLRVRHSVLKGIEIGHADVVLAIDELPILSLVAAMATGTTVIRGAEELRVKESDRIQSTAALLRGLGVRVEEHPDGMTIEGLAGDTKRLKDANVVTRFDHRIAMTAAIASTLHPGMVEIEEVESVKTSFPGFFDLLAQATPA